MRPQLLPASPSSSSSSSSSAFSILPQVHDTEDIAPKSLDSTGSDSDSTQPAPPCIASHGLAFLLPFLVLPSTDVLALSHLVSARLRLESCCFISNCFHLVHLTCYRLLSTCIGISIGLSRVTARAAFPGKQADGRAATTTTAAFTPPSTRLISTRIIPARLVFLSRFI